MISKEKFAKIMNHLRNREDMAQKILQIHLDYDIPVSDAKMSCPRDFGLEDIVLDLLVNIFHDGQDLISTWMVDGDFGRDINGRKFFYNCEEIDLDTPEKLYDLLMEFYKRIEVM